jgi:hypothetical protein
MFLIPGLTEISGHVTPSMDNYADFQQELTGRRIEKLCQDDNENTEDLEGHGAMLRGLVELEDVSESPVLQTSPQDPSERDVTSFQHRIKRIEELIQLLEVMDDSESGWQLSSSESTREPNRLNIQTGASKQHQTVPKTSSEREIDVNREPYTQKDVSETHDRQRKDGISARKDTKFEESSPEIGSATFWAKELLDACKLLKLMCDHFVSAQPNISGTFLRLTSTSPALTAFYLRLADVYFVLSAFSSLLLSAIANITSEFSLSHIMEIEPQYLVTTIKKLTHVYAKVESEFQAVYTTTVYHALSAKSYQRVAELKRHEQTGNQWLVNGVFRQLNVAKKHLTMVSEKLYKFCDPDNEFLQESSSDQPDFETDSQQPSVKERFRIVGQKLCFLEERLSCLTQVLKTTRNAK